MEHLSKRYKFSQIKFIKQYLKLNKLDKKKIRMIN